MSTESGLPDFRSSLQGIWKDKDPTQFASTHALKYNRNAFIDFYRMRIEGLRKCHPNQGHRTLAEWEKRGMVSSVITQNVDGFHQRAGSQHVVELHGSLRTIHCHTCGVRYDSEQFLTNDGISCSSCGGFLRPSVVLFGEKLPEDALQEAEQQMKDAELCIVLGSSLQVSPANWFPQLAKNSGAKLVIVNRETTLLDDMADLLIQNQKIGDVLLSVEEHLVNS